MRHHLRSVGILVPMITPSREEQERIVRTYQRQSRLAGRLGYLFALLCAVLWGWGGPNAPWFSLSSVAFLALTIASIYFMYRCPNCHRFMNERCTEFCPYCKA